MVSMNRDMWAKERAAFNIWRAQITEWLTPEEQAQLNRALNYNTPKDEAEGIIDALDCPPWVRKRLREIRAGMDVLKELYLPKANP